MQIDLNEMIRRTLEEIAGPDKTTALPHRQPAGSFRIALLVLPEIELQKKDNSAKSSRKKPTRPPKP
ncbi:MAG: hypothetical protein K9K88_07540 [Desulfobacterales bacterium]|nr:hypothetical protein [Desulfobacterales bacterium]